MTPRPPEFDAVAEHYEEQLKRGLGVSGENRQYFAQKRIEWLRSRLPTEKFGRILDYGCGDGESTGLLKEHFQAEGVVGADVSTDLLEIARRQAAPGVEFCSTEALPTAEADLAYCNGVFHHIPPVERAAAVQQVFRALKPGGWFSFWENNPWNPGTRLVMKRIPFDRDAITLSVLEARQLLREGGFTSQSTQFLFIFPRHSAPCAR